MTINTTRTVRELAVEIPGTTRIFEKLGIDYCCGGNRSLEDACAAAGVPVGAVVRSLEQAGGASVPGAEPIQNWRTGSLSELISYILETHHSFTRQEIERLTALLAKVCSVHGQNHPELLRIQALFQDLAQELTPHMLKEERILFPYIGEMDDALHHERRSALPPFGTVQNPIRMMMLEHDAAGEVLRQIRQASGNYTVPSDACVSFQTLYQALEAFEQDLHQHIHLENNVLFPRAVEMEGTL